MKYVIHEVDFHRIGPGKDEYYAQATDPGKPGLVLTLRLKGQEAESVWGKLLDKGDSVDVELMQAEIVAIRKKGWEG